ncbi:MAG: glutamate--tRNA ligase, partial [Pseudomonadota bacterium]
AEVEFLNHLVGAVGRSPARFDFTKLEHMNGHYMRAASPDRLMDALTPVIDAAPDGAAICAALDAGARAPLRELMPGLAERAKTLTELLESARFLFAVRPLAMDEKAAKLLTDEARAHLAALHGRLGAVEPWSVEAVEAAVRAYVSEVDAKLGKVAQPLRAALTGTTTSPGIFDVIAALGREEALGRIADQAA